MAEGVLDVCTKTLILRPINLNMKIQKLTPKLRRYLYLLLLKIAVGLVMR